MDSVAGMMAPRGTNGYPPASAPAICRILLVVWTLVAAATAARAGWVGQWHQVRVEQTVPGSSFTEGRVVAWRASVASPAGSLLCVHFAGGDPTTPNRGRVRTRIEIERTASGGEVEVLDFEARRRRGVLPKVCAPLEESVAVGDSFVATWKFGNFPDHEGLGQTYRLFVEVRPPGSER